MKNGWQIFAGVVLLVVKGEAELVGRGASVAVQRTLLKGVVAILVLPSGACESGD